MVEAVFRMLLGLVVVTLGSACGDDMASWEPGRPRVDRFRLLQQSPQDPLALEVVVDFVDTDGDLGVGKLRLMLDCEQAAERPLTDVFEQQTPSIPLDAVDGSLEIVVRLTESIQTGDKIRIGVILEDRAERQSNEPYFEIQAL